MTTGHNRELANVPPVVPPAIIPFSEGAKPRDTNLFELRICASFVFVLLVTGTVIFVLPKVWPDLAGLPVIWPVLLPLVGFLAALSRRSYLRYVRVRQV